MLAGSRASRSRCSTVRDASVPPNKRVKLAARPLEVELRLCARLHRLWIS